MNNRITLTPAAILAALASGLLSLASAAGAAPPDKTHRDTVGFIKKGPVAFKKIKRGQYIYGPFVPYIAYDYPYYYSRGFYPTHIGPGYIYKVYGVRKDDVPKKSRRRLGSRSDIDRCSRRFRSFERRTGLYTTYGGEKKLCPYLR